MLTLTGLKTRNKSGMLIDKFTALIITLFLGVICLLINIKSSKLKVRFCS